MRRRGALVLPLAALVLCACEDPPQLEPKRPKPTLAREAIRLDDGLDVELLAGPCGGATAVAVLFEVGADHDPPERSGMASVVARLLAAAAGDDRIVTSGRDHTLVASSPPPEELEAELEQLAAWMRELEIDDAALERARREVLDDIAARRGGDPARMAVSYAAESIRPSRGGDGWRGGVAEQVEAIELTEVQAWWEAHFKPETARLVVVGELDPGDARAAIERAFAQVPAGRAPAERDAATSTVRGTLVMGDAPSAVAIAVPAPAPSDPSYPAFLVLAARLAREGAEPRDWAVRYDPIEEPETLFVTGARQPVEPPEQAAASLRREMTAALSGPLAPDDLAAARERYGLFLGLHDRDPLACRSDARVLAIARARRAQLGLDDLPLAERLEATTDEQIEEATARFGPRESAAVIAGGTIR